MEQQAEKKIHHHKKLKRRALYILRKFETYSEALEEEIEALRGLLNANKVEIGKLVISVCLLKQLYTSEQKKKVHRFTNNLQGLQNGKRLLLKYYSMKCFTF